jgi:hypothetical protein
MKTLEKAPFLGCAELSGILRISPHFEKPTLWDLLSPNLNTFLQKSGKRNGIARRNWTFIFVHFSKVPIKVCKDPR